MCMCGELCSVRHLGFAVSYQLGFAISWNHWQISSALAYWLLKRTSSSLCAASRSAPAFRKALLAAAAAPLRCRASLPMGPRRIRNATTCAGCAEVLPFSRMLFSRRNEHRDDQERPRKVCRECEYSLRWKEHNDRWRYEDIDEDILREAQESSKSIQRFTAVRRAFDEVQEVRKTEGKRAANATFGSKLHDQLLVVFQAPTAWEAMLESHKRMAAALEINQRCEEGFKELDRMRSEKVPQEEIYLQLAKIQEINAELDEVMAPRAFSEMGEKEAWECSKAIDYDDRLTLQVSAPAAPAPPPLAVKPCQYTDVRTSAPQEDKGAPAFCEAPAPSSEGAPAIREAPATDPEAMPAIPAAGIPVESKAAQRGSDEPPAPPPRLEQLPLGGGKPASYAGPSTVVRPEANPFQELEKLETIGSGEPLQRACPETKVEETVALRTFYLCRRQRGSEGTCGIYMPSKLWTKNPSKNSRWYCKPDVEVWEQLRRDGRLPNDQTTTYARACQECCWAGYKPFACGAATVLEFTLSTGEFAVMANLMPALMRDEFDAHRSTWYRGIEALDPQAIYNACPIIFPKAYPIKGCPMMGRFPVDEWIKRGSPVLDDAGWWRLAAAIADANPGPLSELRDLATKMENLTVSGAASSSTTRTEDDWEMAE